jgi:hypothetical protein
MLIGSCNLEINYLILNKHNQYNNMYHYLEQQWLI